MTDDQLTSLARPRPLDPYSSRAPHLVAVVDTNVLLSSIDNDCRNEAEGRRSRLLRMSDRGDVVLYAADHVLDEVYEHLPTIAASSPVPLAALRARFEDEYLPALRFVTMSDVDAPDPQVLAITDPDDVPTGRLAKLIAPCVVFSDDRHLKKPGFAPKRWIDSAGAAVEVADASWDQLLTANTAILPFRGMVGLISYTGRKIGISPWLLGVVVLGVGAVLLKRPDRRRSTLRVVEAVFEAIVSQLAVAMEQERRGVERLRKAVLDVPAEPTLRQQVAIVLARQHEPLLAAEVHGLICEWFPDALGVSIKDVWSILADGTEFVRVLRYRWRLGGVVAPAC
ncbi:hypothetical protein ACI2L1_23105 [Streptomyces sp. NPDC019531]|uniref:hypothetical protein n=1 Tax=Streptomyces sp. NPDC019531 TaxID=3365062 RepID=UPI00384CB80E